MKLYKVTALAAALLLAVSMNGCRELPMESYAPLTAEQQTVIVGETLTLYVPLPTEKAKGIAAVVSDGTAPCISADYTAPDLKIAGIAEGTAEVRIEFSAGLFYKKSSITIPIVALLPQLEAEISSDTVPIIYEEMKLSSGDPQKVPVIKINVDDTAKLTVKSAESDISVAVDYPSGDPSLEVKADNTDILLAAKRDAGTLFTVTVSKEGFRDAALPCFVEITAVPAHLSRPEGAGETIKVEKGKTVIVPLETNGELSVSPASPNITAVVEGGKLKLTGVTEGEFTVTVVAKKEKYLDSSLALTGVVTAPAPPAPAPVSATPTGEYASIISEILNYTNIERANVGLPALKLNNTLSGAAAIRAKETATNESHTRPDGRRGLTAIADAGLGDYDAEGENLSGSGKTENGAEIVQRWMDSPPHRDAILLPQFKTIGIGVYYDGDMYRYCQLFTGTKL